MKKKLLALVLVLALAATGVVGASMAYLTDEDSDVNVMTLGNVDIEQIEQERDPNGNLVDFTQAKPVYPAVYEGSSIPWADAANWPVKDNTAWKVVENNANVVDKFVTVKNTGKSDAYVRTIIAFEVGKDGVNDAYMHFVCNDKESTKGVVSFAWLSDAIIEVDDGYYAVGVFTYNEALAAGETSLPSVKQVYLDKNATNEVCEAYGETFEILVLSQAIQTEGFSDAATALNTGFGEVNAENAAKWFNAIPRGYQVSNSDELAAAVDAGETEIWLNPGTYKAPAAAKGKTLTINGTKDAVLEVVSAGQGEANGQLDYSFDGSKVEFNGITIKTNSQLYAGYARLSGTYNDCVIQNTYNLGTGESAFYNCEINITNEYLRVGGATTALFDGCTFNTDGRAILVFQDGTSVAQTVTVKDCTFNATDAAYTWDSKHVAAVSIDGTNGTYVVNLEGTNTVDSDFNGLWQIKAGEANVTVNE